MNQGRTVFSQLVEFLPTYQFQICVDRYQGNRYVKEKQICCHARNTLDSKGVGEKKADGSSTRSVLTSFHVGRIIYTDIRQSGHRPATSSGCWIGTRTRPIPIFLRSRSGYLRRAFSANFLVLNGFDKMTSSRPWYSNSSHRTDDFIGEF